MDAHDLVMFDLDGVVYVGTDVIEGVAEQVDQIRASGRHVAFVTNNASRTPDAGVGEARRDGGPCGAGRRGDVCPGGRPRARGCPRRGRQDPHARRRRSRAALVEAGLEPVEDPDGAVAVASGYGPDVRWRDIMRVASLVRDGLPYVASNADMTIPTAYGLAPGHGVLVQTITGFAGVEATVAGKPEKPLMEETVLRVGGDRPIMVGDRLDTDIEGAHAIGVPSLLVLTGVTWLDELAAASPELRPTYISPDLGGLFEPHPAPAVDGSRAELGGWSGAVVDGRLEVEGTGSDADWWRVAATACWLHLDEAGEPADVTDTVPPGPARRLGAE